MGLSRATKAVLPEIEEACRISRDNEGIGRYYHVPLYDVLAIRMMMEAPIIVEPRISLEEHASSELREATNKAIFTWGRRRGLNVPEAKMALLYGVLR